ncbi:MAG: hypothetical protein CENE_00241 [Candidatus Celerinatantimonas neptuna]|nr:MAG: hypothetical protein CENE_00241 [Candidatus Celerinatantimonas neptuna]
MQLKQWRLHRGWTQQQLAELSDLSVRTIARLENGQTPSLESLNALAAVFEVKREVLQHSLPPQPGLKSEQVQDKSSAQLLTDFKYKVLSRLILIIALFIINIITGHQFWWAIWPSLIIFLALATRGVYIYLTITKNKST